MTMLRALVALTVVLHGAAVLANESGHLAGWYRLGSGETVLVTFASDGGLMMNHFGQPPFAHRLRPAGDRAFLWARGEKEPARDVRFAPGAPTAALRWRDSGGKWQEAPRVSGPYRVEERSFHNGPIALSGTLFLPNGPGPYPGAVFIHGSGVSTRDNFWYVFIADRLARNGIAVLLPDKRGCGRSKGDWKVASFRDYAADAGAAVTTLAGTPGVARDRVGVIGISQGGHIAPMVPKLVPALAYVVNLSGSAVPIEQQLHLELTNTLRQEGWPRFMVPVVRPIAIRVVKRRMPRWWEMNGKLDPILDWRRLTVPALAVYGALDEQDNVPVTKSVERLRNTRRVEVIVYPDSGHALYAPGTRRIREDFLATLVEWIVRRSAPKSQASMTSFFALWIIARSSRGA